MIKVKIKRYAIVLLFTFIFYKNSLPTADVLVTTNPIY